MVPELGILKKKRKSDEKEVLRPSTLADVSNLYGKGLCDEEIARDPSPPHNTAL